MIDREWERAIVFGLIEPPSRRSEALAAVRRWALAIPIALLTTLGAPTAAALANTYFVSNGNDSGTGSLRAAISAANTNPGPDTITYASVVTSLTVKLTRAVPRIGQEVLVNFLEGDPDRPIVIDAGSASSPIQTGLVLGPGSGGSTLEGVTVEGTSGAGVLVQSSGNGIYYFFSHNDGHHGLIVQGSNNTIGGVGANTIDGSSGAGILIQPPTGGAASGNLVVGNTIGTDTLSDPGLGNLGGGVLLLGNSSGNTIGGSAAGDGNLISGNGGGGVIVQGAGAIDNLVEGNTVGLTKDRTGALPNHTGVLVDGGASNDTFTFNTISGNSGTGVQLGGNGTSGNAVTGNFIGTDSSGDALGNGSDGVLLTNGAANNAVGGTAAGDGNTIAFNANPGIVVNDSVTIGNSLLGNALFSNGANRTGPGIRLLNGGNASQAAPAITSIQTAPTGTMLSGRAVAGARVEAFANASCLDPEGKQFLGAATADSSGSWSMLIPAVQSGSGITATQTSSNAANTSQFSRCATAP